MRGCESYSQSNSPFENFFYRSAKNSQKLSKLRLSNLMKKSRTETFEKSFYFFKLFQVKVIKFLVVNWNIKIGLLINLEEGIMICFYPESVERLQKDHQHWKKTSNKFCERTTTLPSKSKNSPEVLYILFSSIVNSYWTCNNVIDCQKNKQNLKNAQIGKTHSVFFFKQVVPNPRNH